MGILRIVLGMAVMFACLYFMLMRNARVKPPSVPGVPASAGSSSSSGSGTALTAPGQTAEHMKHQFEEAAKKQDEAADDVQKKLDDAVQGK